ncbi:tetratricopeptide repeat protein [Actinomadura xylanilytica]|uniref:tetratricopeptide repeat protein n=1 Tax=Actinomadura xylanilytica TaxID=887459 RepID=UPI00255AD6C9|nr:tetratricopeptide repeat protein [Actinomadura xylanilytica]MDL4772274.1 tetratricopeptide repeat protein [Actinomadura xylanilytica]
MRAKFEDSYRELSPEAARLFRLLGLHPGGGMGIDAAAALAGRTEEDTADLLDLLVDGHLVAETGDGRFRLHDLLRVYARECAERDETQDGRDAALRGVLDFYLAGAAAADRTLGPGRWRLGPAYDGVRPLAGKADAWEWLDAERENLRAAVEAAHARGWDEHVWWLCEALWYFYFLRKHYRDWIDTHELGVESAVRCGDGAAEARMRTQLGSALAGRHRVDEAVREYTAARDAARAAGHRQGEATAVESLGLELLGQERWDEAAEALETNVRLAGETGDPHAILLARHHLGRALSGVGDRDRALELLEPLPDAFVALAEPDRYNRGRALTSLGQEYLRRDRPDAAVNFFGQALEIMRAERAAEQQADLWCHLADAARLRRDPDAERAALAEARPLYESLGSPRAAGVAARMETV